MGTLTLFEPVVGGGPQPRAERHTLSARLLDEPVTVLIGNNQLDPCHYSTLPKKISVCMHVTHAKGQESM